MAETKTNTDNAGIFEGIGSWLGSLAGGKPSNDVPLVKPTNSQSTSETPAPAENTNAKEKGAPEITTNTSNNSGEKKDEMLPSMLKILNSMSSQKSGSAKNAAAIIAGKMFYQPTPTQFMQYVPPQKKRIASISGRK